MTCPPPGLRFIVVIVCMTSCIVLIYIPPYAVTPCVPYYDRWVGGNTLRALARSALTISPEAYLLPLPHHRVDAFLYLGDERFLIIVQVAVADAQGPNLINARCENTLKQEVGGG